MKYVFASVFAHEMEKYLNLLSESGRYVLKIQSTLRSLDKYLVDIGLSQKVLNADTVSEWLKTRNVSPRTKVQNVGHTGRFVKHLASLGIAASCPEIPKERTSYVPYIFSDIELIPIPC